MDGLFENTLKFVSSARAVYTVKAAETSTTDVLANAQLSNTDLITSTLQKLVDNASQLSLPEVNKNIGMNVAVNYYLH